MKTLVKGHKNHKIDLCFQYDQTLLILTSWHVPNLIFRSCVSVNGEVNPTITLTLIRKFPISNSSELVTYTTTYFNFKILYYLFFVITHIHTCTHTQTHTCTQTHTSMHTHTNKHTHTFHYTEHLRFDILLLFCTDLFCWNN